jgi:hypothetical protein
MQRTMPLVEKGSAAHADYVKEDLGTGSKAGPVLTDTRDDTVGRIASQVRRGSRRESRDWALSAVLSPRRVRCDWFPRLYMRGWGDMDARAEP